MKEKGKIIIYKDVMELHRINGAWFLVNKFENAKIAISNPNIINILEGSDKMPGMDMDDAGVHKAFTQLLLVTLFGELERWGAMGILTNGKGGIFQ